MKYLIVAGFSLCILTLQPVFAEKKTSDVIERVPLNNYQLGLQKAVMPPNQVKPLHMHTGPEVAYVLEGEVIITVKKDGAEVTKSYKAGESFQHPAYEPHITKTGPKGAVVLASWVKEEGRDLAVPVP